MRRLLTISAALLAAGVSIMRAQNVADLIISEAMAASDSSIVDDYGRRNGWVEIFNTSQGIVSYGGCYLTDDRNNLKKSLIPKGDARTSVGPRQTVLFYASGNAAEGTFYAGFEIRPGTTVYLVSNDGRTIVDSLEVPRDLPEGKSVSKTARDIKQMAFETEILPTEPTPGIPNGILTEESGSQKMEREDPYGWILTIISVGVVFLALTILFLLFRTLFQPREKRNPPASPKKPGKGGNPPLTPETAAAISLALDMENSGEIYAAIAAAIDLYRRETVHDQESFIITIRPSAASGWTDKVHNFRKLPRR